MTLGPAGTSARLIALLPWPWPGCSHLSPLLPRTRRSGCLVVSSLSLSACLPACQPASLAFRTGKTLLSRCYFFAPLHPFPRLPLAPNALHCSGSALPCTSLTMAAFVSTDADDKPHHHHLPPPPPSLQQSQDAFAHQYPNTPTSSSSQHPRISHRPSADFRHNSSSTMPGQNANGPVPVPAQPSHGRMNNGHAQAANLRDMPFAGPRSPPNNKSRPRQYIPRQSRPS